METFLLQSKKSAIKAARWNPPNIMPPQLSIRHNPDASRPHPEGNLFLQKVQMLVNLHLPDNLQVQDLADALFLTRVQVFRKIKALTGESPSRFVQHFRLKMACEKILSTRQSISEIAYSVGFSDPKYFSRVFTREYGKSPSYFRKHVSTFFET